MLIYLQKNYINVELEPADEAGQSDVGIYYVNPPNIISMLSFLYKLITKHVSTKEGYG